MNYDPRVRVNAHPIAAGGKIIVNQHLLRRIDKNRGNTYSAIRFTTKLLSCFIPLHPPETRSCLEGNNFM